MDVMTPNRTIYVINQSPELLKAWRELSESQKRAVIKDCETAKESDVERVIEEIADGQRRLFWTCEYEFNALTTALKQFEVEGFNNTDSINY